MNDVFVEYECGTRIPALDPQEHCPECNAEIVKSAPFNGSPANAVAKVELCSTREYVATVDVTVSVPMGNCDPEDVENHALRRANSVEFTLESRGFVVEDIDFDYHEVDP